MKHVTSWLGWVASVVLLGSGPALAQSMPPPTTDPDGVNESNQTRELEGEIEQYPGPNDGMRDDSASEPRIPERMQTPPKKPSEASRPHAASPASPARSGASASAASSIDPSEVQRVFGSDARVIALGSLDAASITRLQVRLHELGHYKGVIDGILGPQTRAAIESYARQQFVLKQRLLKRDQLTTDLAQQLGVEGGAANPPPSTSSGDMGPSMRDGAPLLPPGGAPAPSTSPPKDGNFTPATPSSPPSP